MNAASGTIIVPIRVDALAIDDTVPLLALRTTDEDGFHIPADGKWSPGGADWEAALQNFTPPGPPPFFGGVLRDGVMELLDGNPFLPGSKDRGIYLHWVLPNGMRHGYRPDAGSRGYPPLPHNWLVVRLQRERDPDSGTEQTGCRAWLVETDKAAPEGGSRLLGPAADGNYLTDHTVGVVSDYPHGNPPAGTRPVVINALGSDHMGAVSFAALVADNRNVLSFHDDLADFQSPDGSLQPGAVSFSYVVLGWYRDDAPEAEPLAFVRRHLPANRLARDEKQAVLDALGWRLDDSPPGERAAPGETEQNAAGGTSLPDDLLQHRALFHGLVADVNYFDRETYLGPLLGYPGAPPAHAESRSERPTVNVGIGNAAADALIALVADGTAATASLAAWKALEAVVYRQPRALLENWRQTPLEHTIHKSWFTPLNGGVRWRLRGEEQRAADAPPAPGAEPAAGHRPPPAVVEKLQEKLARLNAQQARANALAREIAALQQTFYSRWWRLVRAVLTGSGDPPALEHALGDVQRQIAARRTTLETQLLGEIARQRQALADAAAQAGMKLQSEGASRFYQTPDPVIVIQNAGASTRYRFPNTLPCRAAVAPLGTVALDVAGRDDEVIRGTAPDGLAAVTAALRQLPRGDVLALLLEEANLVAQTLHTLARMLLPESGLGHSETAWQEWTGRLEHALDALAGVPSAGAGDGPSVRLQLEPRPADPTLFSRLGTLWLRQPWHPLFLDWQITWFPDEAGGDGLPARWQYDARSHDYRPTHGHESAAGIPVRGRSLMAPQMGRVFSEPVAELLAMLDGAPQYDWDVETLLKPFAEQWQGPLRALLDGDVVGQALTGFNAALLGHDPALLHMLPDGQLPWLVNGGHVQAGSPLYHDAAILTNRTLEPAAPGADAPPVKLPGLVPPDVTREQPFSLLQSGSFRVDALWIVDDFGQWFDVLGGSSEGAANPLRLNPHIRWPDDGGHGRIARPPRLLQPARLHFGLVDGDFQGDGAEDGDPVCGWVFHNFLDQALTLCDSAGNVLGELQLLDGAAGGGVRWHCLRVGAGPETPIAESIDEPTLRDFALGLQEEAAGRPPRLQALLALIDDMLADIRPAAGTDRWGIVGRPLALVNARVGFELFGDAWDDPLATDHQAGTSLAGLTLPIELGQAASINDGLIGYFKRGKEGTEGMTRMVAARPPAGFEDQSGYLLDAAHDKDAVRAGFGAANWEALTLLLDPHGIVHAACGILPGARLALPPAYLDRARENMTLSIDVAPILLPGSPGAGIPLHFPVALPAKPQNHWLFEGPGNHQPPFSLLPPTHHPDYAAGQLVAVEGRLVASRDDGLERWLGTFGGILLLRQRESAGKIGQATTSMLRDWVRYHLHLTLQEPADSTTIAVMTDRELLTTSALVAFLEQCGEPGVALTTIAGCKSALQQLNQRKLGLSLDEQAALSLPDLIRLGVSWSAPFRDHVRAVQDNAAGGAS